MLLGTVEEGVDEGFELGVVDDGSVELGALLLRTEVLGVELLGELLGVDSSSLSEAYHRSIEQN